jgi:hypothetical protein
VAHADLVAGSGSEDRARDLTSQHQREEEIRRRSLSDTGDEDEQCTDQIQRCEADDVPEALIACVHEEAAVDEDHIR